MNPDMIKHLAELSKISFTEDELNKISSDISGIIALIDKVRDFNTDVTTDTVNTVDYKSLRADTHKPSYPTQEIIKNAKNVTGNSFTVPKVV